MPKGISAEHELLLWLAAPNIAQALDTWRSSCPRQTVWEMRIIEGIGPRSFAPAGSRARRA